MVRIVICRRDLPRNPRWREQRYPYENCWGIDELFGEAAREGPGSRLWAEARRIFWEAYWRLRRHYKRGRPFFEVFIEERGELKPLEDRERWVLYNIIASAFAYGVAPSYYGPKLYERLYGRLAG